LCLSTQIELGTTHTPVVAGIPEITHHPVKLFNNHPVDFPLGVVLPDPMGDNGILIIPGDFLKGPGQDGTGDQAPQLIDVINVNMHVMAFARPGHWVARNPTSYRKFFAFIVFGSAIVPKIETVFIRGYI
jgi:hypothetical protein